MIILVYWYPSTDKIYRDSNYRVVEKVIKSLPQDKYSFIINYPVIKGKKPKHSFKQKNVLWYGVSTKEGRMLSVFLNDWSILDKVKKTIPVSFIWNNLSEIGDVFSVIFQNGVTKVPVSSQHHYVMHKSLGEVMYHKEIFIRQVIGALASDMNIFHSFYSIKLFRESLEDEDIFNKISLNVSYIPHAVVTDELINTKDNRGGKIKLIYNHRLETYKNYLKTFNDLDEIYKEGYDFEMFVTFGQEKKAFVDKFKWAKVVNCPEIQDYYNLLKQCDFGVLESRHETFCISAVEAMASNIKMYLPNGLTFNDVADERAFLFNGSSWKKQLKKDMNNIEEIRKEKASEKYLKRFSTENIKQKWQDLFKTKKLLIGKDHIKDYIKNTIKDGLNFQNYYSQLTKDLKLG